MLSLGSATSRTSVLDPPDGRQIRDGMALLHELGALDRAVDAGKRLTPLGRRLASYPSTRAWAGWCWRPTA